MINVAVSGAMGRLGRAISSGVAAAEDMQLTGLYAPGHEGESLANIGVSGAADPLHVVALVGAPQKGIADRRVGRIGIGRFLVDHP